MPAPFGVAETGATRRPGHRRLRPDAVEELDVRGPSGQDGKRVAHAAQIELGDDRMVALLDQEAPALGRQILTDELEFGARQVKAFDVVRELAARVRKEDLRRALLDDGVGDRGGEGVAGRLRRRTPSPRSSSGSS